MAASAVPSSADWALPRIFEIARETGALSRPLAPFRFHAVGHVDPQPRTDNRKPETPHVQRHSARAWADATRARTGRGHRHTRPGRGGGAHAVPPLIVSSQTARRYTGDPHGVPHRPIAKHSPTRASQRCRHASTPRLRTRLPRPASNRSDVHAGARSVSTERALETPSRSQHLACRLAHLIGGRALLLRRMEQLNRCTHSSTRLAERRAVARHCLPYGRMEHAQEPHHSNTARAAP
jgi:hypothetical protein